MEYCLLCKTELGNITYKWNGETLCKSCFSTKPSVKSDSLGFYTSKDSMWNFDVDEYERKIHISSKGQWKRYLKAKGMHDDRPQGRGLKPAEYREHKVEGPKKEWIRDQILKEMQEKGLRGKLIERKRR